MSLDLLSLSLLFFSRNDLEDKDYFLGVFVCSLSCFGIWVLFEMMF